MGTSPGNPRGARALACIALVTTFTGGCTDSTAPPEVPAPQFSCTADNAAVIFDYTVDTRTGTFCTVSAVPSQNEATAATTHWAVALVHANRWLTLTAHRPGAVGAVNHFFLDIPSRRFGTLTAPGLWNGIYNLGCLTSTDYGADGCWGLQQIGYCLADVSAPVPECLPGWPEGLATVFRVGFISSTDPSDEEYEFDEGQLTLTTEITGGGQLLTGTFSGRMRRARTRSVTDAMTITNGRLRIVTRNAPLF